MKTTKLAYCLLVPAVCLVPPIQAAIKTYHYDQNARLTNSLKNNLASHDYVYDGVGNSLIKYTLPQQSSYTAPELEITYSEALNKPINPAHPTFSWDTDETTSPVLYDLYLGEENPPSIYKKNLTLSEIEAEYLKPKTKYFWKVIARDHHNQVIAETETVKLTTLNNPPNKPVLVAFDKHKNTLSWKLPEQDPDPNVKIVAYDVYLSEVGKPLALIAENITNTSIELTTTIKPNTGYQWSVVAIDNQGLKSEMAKTGVFQWLDFEIDYLGDYYWHYQGSSHWERAEGKGKDRSTALATTEIVDDQQVAISTTMHSAGGLVSFDVATSSENSHWLRFYIDGQKVGEWNGRKNYHHVEFLVTAGHHELKWVYQKESDAVRGENSIWLDNLVIPALHDSDNDGVADDWEYTYFDSLDTDFTQYDASLDTDQDGVTDLDEAKAFTNPKAKDTDKDGMPDGWEITNRLNPLVVDNNGDIDSNGQNNLSDYVLSVEDYPADVDTDKDGMPDSWEVAHGLNPAVKDNKEDTDSDDRLNEEEYVAGTDPQDSSSVASKTLIDFEDDTLGGYSWRYEGDSQWQRQAEKGKDGSTAQAATGIGVREYMAFSTVVNAEGGLVSFDVATRSDNIDELSFHIDGQKVGEWSGRKDYHHAEFLVMAGRHELRWVYQKDRGSVREDTVWIDNLVIPGLPDSDNDGVIDAWEYAYFDSLDTDFTQYDATLDTDQDGVTDLDEAKAFTNPKAKDTDKDGMPDGWELAHGSNPFFSDANEDANDNELNNFSDYVLSVEDYPTDKDTDGDGMPDAWEAANRLNPLVVDSQGDADNDGTLNVEEYIAGTDTYRLIAKRDKTIDGFYWSNTNNILHRYFERSRDANTSYELILLLINNNYGVISTQFNMSEPGTLSFTLNKPEYVELCLYIDTDKTCWHRYDAIENTDYTFELDAGQHKVEFRLNGSHAVLKNLKIPALADSDGDTVADSWEYQFFGNLDQTFTDNKDSDGDSLTDKEEFISGAHPDKKDSDGDSLPDTWEVTHNLSPSFYDIRNDADNDGATDLEEWIAKTNPRDASSYNKILMDFEDNTYSKYYFYDRFFKGAIPWKIDQSKASQGKASFRSPKLEFDNLTTYLTTEIYTSGGLINFDYFIGHTDGNKFALFINDKEVLKESNTNQLEFKTFKQELKPGRYKIIWRYTRSQNRYDENEDGLWLDNIFLPALPDSDNDGVTDGWEYRFFDNLGQTFTDNIDSDGDGLSDKEEFINGTHPNEIDTDGDSLPDAWEVAHDLSPSRFDISNDADNDGANDLEEWITQTNPKDASSHHKLLIDFEDDSLGGYHWMKSPRKRNHCQIVPKNNTEKHIWRCTLQTESSDNTAMLERTIVNVARPGRLSFRLGKIENAYLELTINNHSGDGYRQVRLDEEDMNTVVSYPVPTGKIEISFWVAGPNNGFVEIDDLIIPALPDSDSDDVKDGWEYQYFYGFDQDFSDKTVDTDGDGLTDFEESTYYTNPKKADTDEDGIPDAFEVAHGLLPFTSSADDDSDKDGVTDYEEWVTETAPKDASSHHKLLIDFEDDTLGGYYWRVIRIDDDGDWQIQPASSGSGKAWRPAFEKKFVRARISTTVYISKPSQVRFKLNKARGTSLYLLIDNKQHNIAGRYHAKTNEAIAIDIPAGKHTIEFYADHDFEDEHLEDLNRLLEIDDLIIPALPDSDNDGVADGWEYRYFRSLETDFTQYDASLDTDQDGITDINEAKALTNPKVRDADANGIFSLRDYPADSDTDRDGLPDAWEAANGLNPAKKDNKEDTDGDGRLNEEEYIAGTDPQDSSRVGEKVVIDFEDDTLGGYFWRYKGASQWRRQAEKGKDGSTALATTEISHGQSMAISTVVHTVGGLLSFDVATRSNYYDRLRFYIDGEKVGEWSGIYDYRHVGFLVPAGRHELKWIYYTNIKSVRDEDRVWIDNLVIPARPDSDNDGVIDAWEYTYFDSLDTDFKTYDASLDTDQDGVTDLDEAKAFTNPKAKDTDKDGMPDEWEITNRLNPLVVDNNGDIDSNGQNNLSDYVLSVEDYPADIDTDKDGMPDSWEVAHGLNPAEKDNTADVDNDGVSNEEEYIANTDPQDAESHRNLLIDFEDDTLGGYFWRYEGASRWQRQAEKGKDGTTAFTATGIGDSQQMAISTVVNSVSGLLSFDVATSSEHLDRLYFYIDGEKVGGWDGKEGYRHAEFLMTAGRHELKWVYEKDSSGVIGEDRVWIDNLFIPALPDTDGDDVVDAWEYTYFDSLDTDFKTYDASLDTDQDGVTDLDEAKAFTNPKAKDTDKDGMPDGWEITNRLNPLVVDNNGDIDSNGQNNLSDYVLSVEDYPADIDTDKDGMPDSWEVAHGLNPALNDNKEDADGDGRLNGEEYVAGTDPQDSSSIGAKLLIDFEDDTLGGYFWRYEGAGRWQRQAEKGKDGSTAFAATGIGDDQQMVLSTVVNSMGGLLSFDVATSSENTDRLRFYIDGEEVGEWHGINDYRHAEFLVAAGRHELKWIYKKDRSESSGEDSVWLDNVFIPAFPDSDNDGVLDAWEYAYFDSLDTDFTQYDATLDTDQDGITDLDEAKAFTNPKANDTDGDGLPDGWELTHGSNVLVLDANEDANSNELNNLSEYIISVEDYPDDIDSDKDGMPDSWEVAHGLNPAEKDNTADVDNDGVSNEREYIANTDPQDAESHRNLLIDFEDDTLGDYYWRYEGASQWLRAAGKGKDGSTVLATTGIDDGQNMAISTVVHTVGGLLSFDVATGSESFDRLLFYIDENVVGDWSRMTNYHHAEFSVSAGRHELKWVYWKGRRHNETEGNVWIDNLFIPALPDTDGDGVVDGWEYTYFGTLDTDFKTYDATLDTDQDGATDINEAKALTNPKANDTDKDGIPDGWELTHGSNPLASDVSEDADGDGQNNLSEYIVSVEDYPADRDTDKDGLPDAWEVAHGLNPATKDNKKDADSDGRLNEEEYVAGTNPQDSSSVGAKLLIDFEDDTLGGYSWRYEGASQWLRLAKKGKEGGTALATTEISHGQNMAISTIVHSVGGLLSFDVATGSDRVDRLLLYIDGRVAGDWSQMTDYHHAELLVPAGRRELKWVYWQMRQTSQTNIRLDNLFIPALPDSDNDGVTDGWEYHYFNKLDHDLNQDSDEDGVTDFDEFQAGTDPKDPLNGNSP
ncbi:hypothetical protein [Zooshikella harenae]|uniref:Fibronectin type-III domain-containing protein n=1 Tax=Zooshikella harenae TaxID=2827238 RepID=A0ABS5ZI44_9GAMM|nr:hypothetical protein [Zooshikella harenae]MBU2713749.1 hypothetical protein [Zooshikella harenae]